MYSGVWLVMLLLLLLVMFIMNAILLLLTDSYMIDKAYLLDSDRGVNIARALWWFHYSRLLSLVMTTTNDQHHSDPDEAAGETIIVASTTQTLASSARQHIQSKKSALSWHWERHLTYLFLQCVGDDGGNCWLRGVAYLLYITPHLLVYYRLWKIN